MKVNLQAGKAIVHDIEQIPAEHHQQQLLPPAGSPTCPTRKTYSLQGPFYKPISNNIEALGCISSCPTKPWGLPPV
jgi:hypothetical protein